MTQAQMIDDRATVEPSLDGLERVIGIKDDGRPGPLVLITCGLHGNEPGGVHAVLSLFEALADTSTAGRIVGLAGNIDALRKGVRHQGLDLNRLWTEDNLRSLGSRPPANDRPDEAELRALFSAIEAERDSARAASRPVVLIDLHSTSADGGAFTVVPDSIPSRRLSRALRLPVVLGLEERIEGPLMTWLVSQGDTATVIEGGQHEAASTREVLFAALLVGLDHMGVLPESDARLEPAHATLDRARGDVPTVLDLVYAHVLDPAQISLFEMRPGWHNFMPVPMGEVLASETHADGTGPNDVDAPLTGYMLMPLYQGLGTEGFFLCRPVSGTWLFASRILRRSWIERCLVLLPGIKSMHARSGRVLAKRGAAHWLTSVLHLFGYRKHAPVGETTEWTRRPQ